MTSRINSPDTPADVTLRNCLDKTPPASFIMIAGAGSGKTTSLVKALSHIIQSKGDTFKKRGQQIACITYTEIAAKEIWNDVGNNPLVHVSTIHSFLWTVIRPFREDIKSWVLRRIDEKIQEKTDKINAPRTHQPTRVRLGLEVQKLESQRGTVSSIPYFTYGTGSNYSKGILGHDDIIKLVTTLIIEHPMLISIVSQKFPYIFIDESQDTFENIVTALKQVDKGHSSRFCLGFFGDPMQKIYPTGIGEIAVEKNWEVITKSENFRCSQEVLRVINEIRRPADGLQQTHGRVEEHEGKLVPVQGSAQIFILPADDMRNDNVGKVRKWCATKFRDPLWEDDRATKIFVIVHRMAAIRLGFPNLYSAMNDHSPSAFKGGLLDGTAWPLRPFINFIIPLITHHNANRNFEVLNLLRAQSPLIGQEHRKNADILDALQKFQVAIDKLIAMLAENSTSTVKDVLDLVNQAVMTVIDDKILNHISGTAVANEEDEDENAFEEEADAMKRFLACEAREFWGYIKYLEDESPFATQQGIKGAEFERVLTILDDEEGTHIHFSYDKYFGMEPLSEKDNENIAEGKDNVVARTRRLFYVSCSRAKKDLVAIYFTSDVPVAREHIVNTGIFQPEKIYTLDTLQ